MNIGVIISGALCILLVVILGFIMVTGIVPFHTAPTPKTVVIKKTVAPHKMLQNFSTSKGQFINDLIAALQEKTMVVEAREDELKAREEKVILQEKVMKDIDARYARMQSELEARQADLERTIYSQEEEKQNWNNLRRIAEMCSKMQPESAVEVLRKMDPIRVAIILSMLDDRPAAKIFDAATASGKQGGVLAASWAEAMERMKPEGEE